MTKSSTPEELYLVIALILSKQAHITPPVLTQAVSTTNSSLKVKIQNRIQNKTKIKFHQTARKRQGRKSEKEMRREERSGRGEKAPLGGFGTLPFTRL